VRRKPYSVVLFDEIEKAHPDTFNILLQVLDDGRLTDSLGRVVDFTNTIIVMTSNVGAKKAAEFGSGIGFSSKSSIASDTAKIESIIDKELKNKFTPEFLNRLDETVLFNQLSSEDMIKIVDIELDQVNERMLEQDIELKFTKVAKEFLMTEGYDPAYGARPLKRAVQKYVEDIVADGILDGKILSGNTYTITYKKGSDKLFVK
jgi:ATP-dependent Clp protease ATP-binding subunit ClpC